VADIVLDAQVAPSTPAANTGVAWPDTNAKAWLQKDDAGRVSGDIADAIIAQIAAHSVDTYYKGIKLPSISMQAGMTIEWEFSVTKGAAGTAAPIYTVRIGAAGTVADTARLTLTGPAQTAAADSAIIQVRVTVRSVGAAGVLRGFARVDHNLAATGFANTPAGFSLTEATAAGFDNSALGGQFIGLSVNPGASGAWVVEQCVQRIFIG
jgi:hypothetical protein